MAQIIITPKAWDYIMKKIERLGFAIETQTKINAPVKTGRLRASYFTTRKKNSVLVGSPVVYAYIQEFIYNPHLLPAVYTIRNSKLKL